MTTAYADFFAKYIDLATHIWSFGVWLYTLNGTFKRLAETERPLRKWLNVLSVKTISCLMTSKSFFKGAKLIDVL
jgi:hypothetical protein